MEFFLASGNAHKAQELQQLCKDSSLTIKAAPQTIDVIEDGESFQENAFKKARAYYQKLNKPTLADDSGIVVNALPEMLGIHSARFAPEFTDYKDKCQQLIKLLKSANDRSAYFVCYLCCYLSPDEIFYFESRCKGQITQELQGTDGFGYDPIFEPENNKGQTFASDPKWKGIHSHRNKAINAATKFFQNR